MRIQLTFIMLGIMLFFQQSGRAQESSVLLSAREFEIKLKEFPAAPLVDVRTPGEYQSGHIPNALNIDWLGGEFEKRIVALDTSVPVFIYCLGGGRSETAADKMRELGFNQVYELDGGLLKWRKEGLPEIIDKHEITELTQAQFEELIRSQAIVMVIFYADWCGQCARLKPLVREISAEYDGRIRVVWINADDNRSLIKDLGVDAIPVVRVYRDEALHWAHTGYAGKEELLEHIQ